MKKSGVYFGSAEIYVRIGCAKDIDDRRSTHEGSNLNFKLIGVIITDEKEIFDEEKRAFNYFEKYKIKKSFYDKKIIELIPQYITQRTLERANLSKKQTKRTGTIQTLWGEENLTSHRKRCDIFPEQYVAFMGKAGTKNGEKPRRFTIEGKTYEVSNRAKDFIQSIRRDTKQKIAEHLNIDVKKLNEQGKNLKSKY